MNGFVDVGRFGKWCFFFMEIVLVIWILHWLIRLARIGTVVMEMVGACDYL